MIEEFNSNGIYVKISNGTMNHKCAQTDKGAIYYDWDNDKGEKDHAYKKEFPALSGKVVEMRHKQGNYGTNLEVKLDDGLTAYVVQFKYESAEYERFVRTAASITNWQAPLRIGVSKDPKFGTAIWLSSGETKFKWKWGGKDDSEAAGIPQWRQKPDGKFDKAEMYEWFYNYVENNIIPQITGEKPEPPQELSKEEALPLDGKSVETPAKEKTAAAPKAKKVESTVTEEEDSELPF